MSVLSDALSSAELQAARPERAPSPRASAWMRLQGWSGTTPPGAGEMGRPGSRGRPCLTPPECAPHVLSDQETLNKPMFEMCFSKYLLSQSFRTQASNTGPRVEPTAGKGLPHQTLPAPTGRGAAPTPQGHCRGGASLQGDGARGTPMEKPGSRTPGSHGGDFPRPQEATLGRSPLPPPCPPRCSQQHLPVGATSQSVHLTLIRKLSICLCKHLAMPVH